MGGGAAAVVLAGATVFAGAGSSPMNAAGTPTVTLASFGSFARSAESAFPSALS